MSECVAVINAGSSSIKFALYEIGQTQSLMFRGLIEKIGVTPQMVVRGAERTGCGIVFLATSEGSAPAVDLELTEGPVPGVPDGSE